MTEKELLRNVSKRAKVSRLNCELVFDALIKELSECLVRGDGIQLKKFVYFETVDWPARKGRNPKTNKIEEFPPVKVVKCRPSDFLKDAVKKGEIEFNDGKTLY